MLKRISEERYASISASLGRAETQLKARYDEMQKSLSRFTQQSKSAQAFEDLIEQYSPIT